MGLLIYDDQLKVEIDDRTLAHLQAVIFEKLRAHEGFSLTLDDDEHEVSVWLNARTAIEFVFRDARAVILNQEWLDVLTLAADSDGGLWVVAEPDLDAELDEFFKGAH
jgi:hypothetical protein